MSIYSERVKEWRRRTKARLVTAFGGSCCVCGYSVHSGCLQFHHLDAHDKIEGAGELRANIRSWDHIVAEMRKCVMVCNRCHVEIHAGVAVVPIDANRFNEEYADYRKVARDAKQTPCRVCGKLKPDHMITCSVECAGRKAWKLNWDTVDLEMMLKTKSFWAIGEELGVSDAAVHKRAKRLGLK
jgi:hypothetical protein